MYSISHFATAMVITEIRFSAPIDSFARLANVEE